MIRITSEDDLATLLARPIAADLERLLRLRCHQSDGFRLAHMAVVEPPDRVDSIVQALGFDPTTNLVDGTRVGEGQDFSPSWEWAERHPGLIELTFILTDDGFAHGLLIPDSADIDPVLADLCRRHI